MVVSIWVFGSGAAFLIFHLPHTLFLSPLISVPAICKLGALLEPDFPDDEF
jgi:hypothetical protein